MDSTSFDKVQYTQMVSIVAAILEVKDAVWMQGRDDTEDTSEEFKTRRIRRAKAVVDHVWRELNPPQAGEETKAI
jgi:hypothetical protein